MQLNADRETVAIAREELEADQDRFAQAQEAAAAGTTKGGEGEEDK